MADHFITSGTMVLTEDCNLACTYCYEESDRRCGKVMSKKTAEDAVEFFIKNAKDGQRNQIDITFFGGEPTLNLDVMKHTFDYASIRTQEEGLTFDCMIVTNATVLTDEYAKFVKHWFQVLGHVNIQVSIDGVPHIQDKNRITKSGSGSSKLVKRTIGKYSQIFEECGIPKDQLHVHGCVNKESLPFMKASYDYYRDELGIGSVWFMPIHEEEWDDADTLIFREQLTQIGNRIVEECERDHTSKYFDAYSSFQCVAQKPGAPCSAGKNFGTIDAEGNVYPCHRFMFHDREMVIGNIRDGVDDEAREFFLEYDMSNLYGDKACQDCSNNNCRICIAANYEANHNMVIGFPRYCQLSRTEDDMRWQVREKLVELGLLEKTDRQSGCGGSCTNCEGGCNHVSEEVLVEKVRKTFRPVFEALDEKFHDLSKLHESYSEALTLSDEKTEQAISLAKDALGLAGQMLPIVEGLHADLEAIKSKLKMEE